MIRFETLLEKVRSYSPEADLELLRRAYVFSALEHKGQIRHSGEPYLVHPLEVADFLAEMKLDPAHVVYVGNDINDLDCLHYVGCAVAPADSHPSVLACAAIVLDSDGGHGAVREICTLIAAHRRRQDVA